MSDRVLLSLDLSRHCGWAAGLRGTKPQFGLWELPGVEDLGRQGAAFSNALADAITVWKVVGPLDIIAEIDVNVHKQNPAAIAEQQIGMSYMLRTVCYFRSVNLRTRTATQARMAILGKSRWSEKDGAKKATVAWARGAGFDITNDNIADALVLWHYDGIDAAR